MSASELVITATQGFSDFELDLDTALPLQGVTAIFGPSGSGKTSLLNIVAGNLRPRGGQVIFGDEVWQQTNPGIWVPPHRRGVGLVFQDGQLFPHLSVRGNLDFAARRAPDTGSGHAFRDVIAAMDLGDLLDRNPQTLSGGEKQRVAIARSLLTRPKLLLLDEPLSALDSARKAELLPFLETLKSQFSIPTLYVSHDVDEVSRIADRVLMLNAGTVVGFGATDDVLSRFGLQAGRNPYEHTSTLSGIVNNPSPGTDLLSVRVGEGQIWLASDLALEPGTNIQLKISARDVSIATARPEQISIQNMIEAQIVGIDEAKRPAFQIVKLSVHGQRLDAVITRKAVSDLALSPGDKVYALIKSATFHP